MPNDEQRDYWTDQAGPKWVEHRARLDAMLAPVTALLVAAIDAGPGERILDIGCGSGELAWLLAAKGAAVTGIDIAAPMVEAARRAGTGSAEFAVADASEFRAETPFDAAVSRFGVMFFSDPVAAFANIRANLAPEGRLAFAFWQAPDRNLWAMVPAMAVRPLLPEAPPPDPHAPGPFAFADEARVRGILEDAGFADIGFAAHVMAIGLSDGGGLEDATEFACQIGPGAHALGELDESERPRARAAIRAALAPHVDENGSVTLPGAIWLVRAIRPAERG
ncbi:MAG: class I SAM-dependent methyltransferase [Parasphingopyxis sp.]|nr:class I SAM-dependent methyltransferase [Sphingomonadales bacterium]